MRSQLRQTNFSSAASFPRPDLQGGQFWQISNCPFAARGFDNRGADGTVNRGNRAKGCSLRIASKATLRGVAFAVPWIQFKLPMNSESDFGQHVDEAVKVVEHLAVPGTGYDFDTNTARTQKLW